MAESFTAPRESCFAHCTPFPQYDHVSQANRYGLAQAFSGLRCLMRSVSSESGTQIADPSGFPHAGWAQRSDKVGLVGTAVRRVSGHAAPGHGAQTAPWLPTG